MSDDAALSVAYPFIVRVMHAVQPNLILSDLHYKTQDVASAHLSVIQSELTRSAKEINALAERTADTPGMMYGKPFLLVDDTGKEVVFRPEIIGLCVAYDFRAQDKVFHENRLESERIARVASNQGTFGFVQ